MNSQLIITVVILTTLISTGFVLVLNVRKAKRDVRELDFKSVSTQLLALTVWVAVLAQILLPSKADKDLYFGMFVFAASVIIGIFLIRSIFREIKTQEVIENLIEKLHQNNKRLKKLDEQKTEFVSLASHQLRGPLSAITGYTSMLIDGDYGFIQPDAKEPLNRILRSSMALQFLIDDYLNVAKIEKGEMEYTIENVNLSEVLPRLIEELSINAEKAGLILKFTCQTGRELIVRADKIKLKNVVANVIDNAIKYTRTGHIYVSCLDKGDHALIKIEDTGIGISPEHLKGIFGKFVRSTDAQKMNVIGTGLGLFVAKVMIEAQGGEIWAESDGIDKGSNFYVKIPLAKKVL